MSKLIAVFSIMVVSFILGVVVLIHGWGLDPKSWWWIIGGGFLGRIFTEILLLIIKDEK